MTAAAKKQMGVAITLPSPFWWFLLAGTPLQQIEQVANKRLFPEHLAHRGLLYIHASADFSWGVVKDDTEDMIRELNWRRKPSLWPSMYDMRNVAGLVVGSVFVTDSKRDGFSISLPSFHAPVVSCADGGGVFPISPGVLALHRKGVAA